MRSAVMARIRGKDTKPELALRRAVWHHGLRYRLNCRISGVRPDMVFKGSRVAIFVDGCFWHGCPVHYVRPRTKVRFWQKKLLENVERDRAQTLKLEKAGWVVLRFWEHEVATEIEEVVEQIRAAVQDQKSVGSQYHWVAVSVTAIDEKGCTESWRLEDLRDPYRSVTEQRQRRTSKW